MTPTRSQVVVTAPSISSRAAAAESNRRLFERSEDFGFALKSSQTVGIGRYGVR
jgi:hypothetical protein